MTALERARRFIQHDAVRTALVIVPLAMSGAANAGLVFNTGGGANAVDSASFPLANTEEGFASTFSSLPNGGAKWWGSSNVYSFVGSGGGQPVNCKASDAVNAPSMRCAVSMTIGGTGTGQLGAHIPAHWDFGLDFSLRTDADVNSWVTDIQYDVAFYFNDNLLVGSGTSSVGDINLSGWAIDTGLASWKVVLTASFVAAGVGNVQLDIPQNSVDIMPLGTTAVPEPASLALATVAFTGLAALRRRRRS